MNRSIGLSRIEPGTSGGTLGFPRAIEAFRNPKLKPSGHFAPWSIQPRIRPISCAESGSPFAGILRSGSTPATSETSRLSPLLPTTIPGPDSPPFRIASRVSIERPPLSLPLAWQFMQRLCRIGLTRVSKSTRAVVAAGTGGAAMVGRASKPTTHTRRIIREVRFNTLTSTLKRSILPHHAECSHRLR